MLAQWDDVSAVRASLSFGLLASLIALIMILLWLEWGHGVVRCGSGSSRPSCAAAGFRAIQGGVMAGYRRAVRRRALEPSAVGVAVDAADTATARRRIDPRLLLTARTLGWRQTKVFCLIKCPLLLRPALLAFATGFSVSMAQYMPTLWLGAGRFSTLTTETVALSSGGSIPILANRALWLLLVTGSSSALPHCYPGSQAIIDEDYVNAEGQQSHHCAAVP